MAAPDLEQQQIDELHGLLLEKQRELETLLASGEDATRPVTLDQQSVGRVSRIDAIQQQQMAIANQQQARQLLKRIELAIQRIEAGEYGACTHCGEPITFARMQAQPFASLCIGCQSVSENS